MKVTADGKVVAWMQGPFEIGPRALGNRSILADPRRAEMRDILNARVKKREPFRPFAPAVLDDQASKYFEIEPGVESPYMLLVADVRKGLRRDLTPEQVRLMKDPDLRKRVNVPRSTIPAITHVDMSARVQTVDDGRNPRLAALLRAFRNRTGCPVLVNTSFNVRGEPIVCTPEDAFRCFMGSEIEVLVVGNCLLLKEEQDPALKIDYKDDFELD